MKRYEKASLPEIPAVECPCGMTRRAFVDTPDAPASIHMVDIKKDSEVHYHKEHSELYLILEGEGFMELDGERIPVKPLDTVLIHPFCRHRAVGSLKIVNVPIPVHDPEDEWFD